MAGFGRRYHPFTAKPTLLVFALLLVSGFGSTLIPGIPFLSMFALPADLIHGMTLGRIITTLPVPSAIAQYSVAVTYYLVAVVLGYLVHTLTGNRNSFP